MAKQLKLMRLQCSFPRLTEINQFYVLGLAEGLKYAQGKDGEKSMVKMPNNSIGENRLFIIADQGDNLALKSKVINKVFL